ncbi:hypothetical protein D3C81_2243500 [compost metagenome]
MRPQLRRIQLIVIILAVHELMHNELTADGCIILMKRLDEIVDFFFRIDNTRLQLLGQILQRN